MFATICVTIDEDESADAYLVIPHDFQCEYKKKKKKNHLQFTISSNLHLTYTFTFTFTYLHLHLLTHTHSLSHTAYREGTHHIHQIPKLARDTAHAVIYVFDATDPAAVRRADRQWVLEQRFPGVPLLFVGNKKDGGRGYKVSFLPFRFFVVCVRVCGRICVGEKKRMLQNSYSTCIFIFIFLTVRKWARGQRRCGQAVRYATATRGPRDRAAGTRAGLRRVLCDYGRGSGGGLG